MYLYSNAAQSLQWHGRSGVSKHRNPIIYSTPCSGYHQSIHSRAPHYWHTVNGIHLLPIDSLLRGSVLWKAFTCHTFIMWNEEPKQVRKNTLEATCYWSMTFTPTLWFFFATVGVRQLDVEIMYSWHGFLLLQTKRFFFFCLKHDSHKILIYVGHKTPFCYCYNMLAKHISSPFLFFILCYEPWHINPEVTIIYDLLYKYMWSCRVTCHENKDFATCYLWPVYYEAGLWKKFC